ncbi:MAG TPA: hypothetical protein VGI74_09270 [Streptosporangiaceae bacterium]|jgi:hypothetical protein
MTFSPSAYNALITKLEAAPGEIISKTNQVISAVNSAVGWIPLLGDAIDWALNKLKGLIESLVNKLNQVLQPARIPPDMWAMGQEWEQIRGQAGTVASTLAGQQEKFGQEWGGIAGGKYNSGVPLQISAASAFSSAANNVMSNCDTIASGGSMFYIAVGTAVASVIVAITAAIISAPTGVGPIISLCAGVVFTLGSIATAIYSLHFTVDGAARNLQGSLTPSSSFPGGAWPIATAQ